MSTNKKENTGVAKDRHILIAVDDSENAQRAVLYVADFLGGSPGFRATLLHIIPEPSEDYFNVDLEHREWIEEKRATAIQILEKYRTILLQSGFREGKVDVVINIGYYPSIAGCILEEQKKLGCCTVVIGRRGISRKEEFIFGSTSNKMLHSAKNCAVWVIE